MTHTEESLMQLADEYARTNFDDGWDRLGIHGEVSQVKRAALQFAIREVLAERDELRKTMHNHFDLAPQHYAAAKEALPILERNMQCPICDTEFADGVLHDTGLALINTFDRAEKAEAECEILRKKIGELEAKNGRTD